MRAASLAVAALAAAAMTAQAQTVYCIFDRAHARVTMPISAEAVGHPGFVLLYATRGDETGFLLSNGQWTDQIPDRDNLTNLPSMPSSFTFDFCIPEPVESEFSSVPFARCAQTSWFAQGFQVHVTYGALTPALRTEIDQREAAMDAHNARLIAAGREPRTFDRQRWIEARIQREARDNIQENVWTVPFIDCRPPDTGGGN
ncbi:MAG: hypothetical protein M1359_10810 [Betaproteobacteria bacterium]|nr:hypothetical protein [Betaproteobacteria bacterium]